MTPLQIQMMLHYYAIAAPYSQHDKWHAGSIAVQEQREQLIAQELLEVAEDKPSGFRATERGRAYVKGLCAMPLPVVKWVIPSAA